MLTRRHFLALSGAFALGPQASLASDNTQTLGGAAFGTYWRLTVPRGAAHAVSLSRIEAIVATVDKTFSPYRADSEISVFNTSAEDGWQAASPEFVRLLDLALSIADRSGGAFDPTIGPLVSRYGFGPVRAQAWGDFTKIGVRPDGVRKGDAALSLDLCGIAKGHAISQLAAGLAHDGVDHFLLDLGGELLASGRHPSGRDWQVGIEGLKGELVTGVRLDGHVIATSGTTAQHYGPKDREVSHIIDPISEEPVNGAMVSVSVLNSDGAIADGWATALMAMPLANAWQTATALSIDALLLVRDDHGVRHVTTGNFARHLLA